MTNIPSKIKNTIDKMTNLEAVLAEDCDTAHDPRLASLLAMHLITQVMDDAYVIANAAKESGQPWRCLNLLKKIKSNRSDSFDEDLSFKASKGDSVKENKIELVSNIVATSTPQKLAAKHVRGSADQPINIVMNDLIGQGDEEIETRSYELTKSTSTFINNLFDMSEVEHIIMSDEAEITDSTTHNDYFVEVTNKIIESHVTNIIVPLEELLVDVTEEIKEKQEITVAEKVFESNISEASFVVDAFVEDIGRDVAFFIEEIVSGEQNEVDENLEVIEDTKIVEKSSPQKETTENDVNLFESAFLTLNRDYDQCSDEDGFPVLQDPKEMILQEVELLTANTSQDNLSSTEPKQNMTEEIATVSGSHKSSLVRRCRLQGARLFACIRGWWRRKAPRKRKGSRQHGALEGMCPLSPAARRRTSSFVDNRLLRSPSPSQPVAWKFNTVNEAVVNSNRWKEYTFDTNPEEF